MSATYITRRIKREEYDVLKYWKHTEIQYHFFYTWRKWRKIIVQIKK